MSDILLMLIHFFIMIKVTRFFSLCVNVSAVLLYFITNSSIHICFMREILFRASVVPVI